MVFYAFTWTFALMLKTSDPARYKALKLIY